jgi:hypothetical protein
VPKVRSVKWKMNCVRERASMRCAEIQDRYLVSSVHGSCIRAGWRERRATALSRLRHRLSSKALVATVLLWPMSVSSLGRGTPSSSNSP